MYKRSEADFQAMIGQLEKGTKRVGDPTPPNYVSVITAIDEESAATAALARDLSLALALLRRRLFIFVAIEERHLA